jgi:hypothetical protein
MVVRGRAFVPSVKGRAPRTDSQGRCLEAKRRAVRGGYVWLGALRRQPSPPPSPRESAPPYGPLHTARRRPLSEPSNRCGGLPGLIRRTVFGGGVWSVDRCVGPPFISSGRAVTTQPPIPTQSQRLHIAINPASAYKSYIGPLLKRRGGYAALYKVKRGCQGKRPAPAFERSELAGSRGVFQPGPPT